LGKCADISRHPGKYLPLTMPATADINETLIREYINRAISDVFKTMLGREPTFSTQAPRVEGEPLLSPEGHRPQVVGTVGFIGDVNGLIYLHLDLAFAKLCTCHLLGMTDAELEEAGDEVINDAIGELTNMTVGSFKNGLCDAGYPCKLTIPSILRGSNFSIEPISSAVRHIYYFDCAEHRVIADILMKADE
jgi:chemotaxis protein CheX